MSKRGNPDNVVPLRRARWRVRPVRQQPDLLRFWPEARAKPMWKRFAPLWLGAVLVGSAYGAFYLTPSAPAAPTAPIEWNAVQAVPQAVEDEGDRAWRERGERDGTPQVQAPERVAAGAGGFGLCHSGGGTNCVVDGDTIWLAGQNIRIADIDAPETHEPRCAEEQALGDRATGRLHELVNSGTVTLTPIDRDADGYGRKLRIVNVSGTSVGATLVSEGLARWYAGGRRSWCG
jgi:hypothetical protein